MALWPAARTIASDIDPASIFVTRDNAAINRVPLGRGSGALTLAVAPGTDHPAIRHRAPYDLVIANILAGPLITLAPDIAAATAPGGHAILAGLIARGRWSRCSPRTRAQGFRLAARGGKRRMAVPVTGQAPPLRLAPQGTRVPPREPLGCEFRELVA